MNDFLFWIGLYNLSAPFVFLPMLFSESFADLVLRRATEIIAEPYAHGPYGRMWLLWVTTVNVGIGAIMMLATQWSLGAQREIIWTVLGIYFAMWLAMLIGARGPRWGRGVYVTHGLWIAQISWAVWALTHE